MKEHEKEFFTILETEKESLQDLISLLEQQEEDFKLKNLVIDLQKYGELTLEEILGLLPISRKHRDGKKSFVLVNNKVDIDEIPEDLFVVPTLHEAEDLIQMEEIERDLGF